MASYSRGERVLQEIRYTLETPTNGTELEKVLHAAARERANTTPDGQISDDALLVTTEDETIVISWTVIKSQEGT